MVTYITKYHATIIICSAVLVAFGCCIILCGCDDRQSDRRLLNDVIEYVEENSGKDDSVKLTDWEFSSNKNDDARYLDSVYLNYSGSYDLLQLDKIRVAINNYMVENPDSFLNSCAICITLSYSDYTYDMWNSSKANYVAMASNCTDFHAINKTEYKDTDYIDCFAICKWEDNGHSSDEIKLSDIKSFEPSIRYLVIGTDITYDDYSFLKDWDNLEGFWIDVWSIDDDGRKVMPEEEQRVYEDICNSCGLN